MHYTRISQVVGPSAGSGVLYLITLLIFWSRECNSARVRATVAWICAAADRSSSPVSEDGRRGVQEHIPTAPDGFQYMG